MTRHPLLLYYAATALFVSLDFGFDTSAEIVNYMISGGAAYVAYAQAVCALGKRRRI